MKLVDLTDRIFGKLKVKERAKNKHTMTCWRCVCQCGNELIVQAKHLKSGRTQSCGCRRTKKGAAFRYVLRHYQSGARKRGLVWMLTPREFHKLTSSPCYYTGRRPSTTQVSKSGETYTYNGIDRLDSSRGYTTDNCVPCYKEINRMKGSIPVQEFIKLVKEIAVKHS
jgi:hypothetical protein